VLRGLYCYQPAPEPRRHRAHVLASGTAMLAALEAQKLLAEHHDVAADVWSATSYQQLRNEALAVERWNRLHPQKRPRVPYVTAQLTQSPAAVVAVTDYIRAVPDQIARFVPGTFTVLGTDGYGRSDTRDALRRHFETDAAHIVVAVLAALGREERLDPAVVSEAMDRYRIDPETPTPVFA
jgi:pyruvate dehydrogenase E1 component